jgi:nucleotide-binding universal stress UspA family protein
MVVVDRRLTDVERRFIEGWVEGVGRKLGIPPEEMQKIAERKQNDLVAIAHKWREDLLKVVRA